MSKKTILHLSALFLIAILLRILYFNFALNELGMNNLLRSLPDTGIYWTLARHFLDYNINGEYWLFQVGGGYAGILAGLLYISGKNLYFVYCAHIIMGSLIPIVIYLIAERLLKNRSVAFLSGLFTAISITSITLSANLLSDVPFVLFMSTGILCLVIGMQSSRWSWYVLAGIILGLAVHIRSITLFFPIVLPIIPIFIGLLKRTKIDKAMLKHTSISAAIMIVLILSWSTRNYAVNDVFVFNANGMKTARLRLAALAMCKNDDKRQYGEIIKEWSLQDSVYFNHQFPTLAQQYNRDAGHFIEMVKTNPLLISEQFLENMHENIICGNFIPNVQIPDAKPLWDDWAEVNKYFFGYFLIVTTLSGLIILYRRKSFLAFVLLGMIYFYFTFFTGFSMWQGSRLHYPAEISFSILSAVAVIELFQYFRKIYLKKK